MVRKVFTNAVLNSNGRTVMDHLSSMKEIYYVRKCTLKLNLFFLKMIVKMKANVKKDENLHCSLKASFHLLEKSTQHFYF